MPETLARASGLNPMSLSDGAALDKGENGAGEAQSVPPGGVVTKLGSGVVTAPTVNWATPGGLRRLVSGARGDWS